MEKWFDIDRIGSRLIITMRISNVLSFGHTNSTFCVTEVENHKSGEIVMESGSKCESLGIDSSERSSYTQVDPDSELSTKSSSNGTINITYQEDITENRGTSSSVNVSTSHNHSNGHLNGNGVTRHQVDLPDLFKRVIHEAPFVPARKIEVDHPMMAKESEKLGVDTKNSIEVKLKPNLLEIEWANKELVDEGRKFIRRHFFSIIFAHLVALAFLLVVKPIQSLLLRTGAIHNKEKSMKRYLLTILHIKRWYESDFLDESSKATEDIIRVRKTFEKAAKNFHVFIPPPADELKLCQDEEKLLLALNDDLESSASDMQDRKNLEKIYTTVKPDVPMSQYDLAVIQYAFFGLISCFPKVFGIHDDFKRNPKGMQGFIHIWAVLGYLLGMEDRFNLCLKENFDEETNEKIFKEIFIFSFKMADSTAIRLWKAMTAGSYRYFFFFRTKSLLLFMAHNVAQVDKCPKLCALMNWVEKFCYFCYSFTMKWELRVPPIRWCLNSFSRTVFYFSNIFYIRKRKHKVSSPTLTDLSIYGSSEDGGTPLAVILDMDSKK